METYDRFDVVRVQFPFTERDASKRRPAVILSVHDVFNSRANHSVVAMVTSKMHTPWPLDCAIEDLGTAGLPVPSIVRFKLFTLDHRLILGQIGHLAANDAERVADHLASLFSFRGQF